LRNKFIYEKAIDEKAPLAGLYYPGPGTFLAESNASVELVFIPITYLGPSILLSGILYSPGPGYPRLIEKVSLLDFPILY
jgi:hypothetical protein